jgi:CBS domain-containing protein
MTMTTDTTVELTASEVMARRFVAVSPEDTLGEAAQKLSAADAGSALVVEYGRLTGILTSRDVIHAIAERVHPSEARVREWMSAEPTAVAPDTPADEAARAMLAGGFHHLPVTQEGRPVGVIGLRAVIGALRPWSPGF